ncbi:regucalcin-like [Eupeodes corollae]|uniref:regucalcin-like n=1 Tax=Eupeodes corollae TaxID=290404 RepID=UPI00249231FA|nr:regucalcin-like [Eupeodes corollae]
MVFQFQRLIILGLVTWFFVGVLSDHECETPYEVEALPESYAHLGEGPHWDVATQNLFMVDIEAGKLKRFDYKLNKIYECQIENETFASFVIPIDGFTDQFAVGIGHRIASVKWDGISKTCKVDRTLLTVEESREYETNRFNDAKCDPRNRLYAGTMQQNRTGGSTGNLYKVTKLNSYDLLIKDLKISNGLAFDENAKKLYHIDSKKYNVMSYDYDINNGEIKNPKVVFELSGYGDNVVPDGMTIDSEGFLYAAINGGSAVFKIDPKNGHVLLKIMIPAKQVTSAAFGGPNLNILYVTTSDETSPSGRSQAFKVTGLGSKGLPMKNVKLENFNI